MTRWLVAAALVLSGAAAPVTAQDASLEDIHVLRSIREHQYSMAGSCARSTTGFDPYPADAERHFSFWSVNMQSGAGKVVDAKDERVAELRGCFGPTSDPARQSFYAEIRLGALAFRGTGEC
jgi:hypothetical protein